MKDLGLTEPAPKPYERPALRSLDSQLAKKPEGITDAPPETPAAPAAPTFKARPSLTERSMKPAAPKAAEEEDDDSDEDEEWGPRATPPASSKMRYAALAVVALVVAGGGYVGYTRYWPKSGETAEETQVATDEKDDEGSPKSSEGEISQSEDPFDGFGDGKSPKVASNQKPRTLRHTPDAEPIHAIDNSKATIRPGKNAPPSDMDLPLELPSEEESGSTELGALHQDEPEDETETESESELPMLASPKAPARNVAAASTAKRTASTVDEIDSSDPYTIDEDRRANLSAKKSQSISILEVNDEEEQETPAVPTPQRAVSRTVVVRSTGATLAPSTLGPADEEEDAWTVDEQPRTTRKPAVDLTDDGLADDDGEVSAIRPKGAPARKSGSAAAIESSTRNGVARSPSGTTASAPKGELYTIAPNDNFWTISRRQYGSGRYFAALAKHNQDRVADPQRLRPGMQISTPPAAALEAKYPELIDKSGAAAAPAPRTSSIAGDGRPLFAHPSAALPASEAPASGAQQAGYFYSKSGEPMYRIGGDDTLGSIAQKHLGRASRWTEIFSQNREILKNPENLTVGTVIRLPPDASKVGWLDSEPKPRR